MVVPDEAPQDVREMRQETWQAAIEHLIGLYRLENGFLFHAFRYSIASGAPTIPVHG